MANVVINLDLGVFERNRVEWNGGVLVDAKAKNRILTQHLLQWSQISSYVLGGYSRSGYITGQVEVSAVAHESIRRAENDRRSPGRT